MLVGCGDVGGRLAALLVSQGWAVHGLRRQAARLPPGVHPVGGDLAEPGCPPAWPVGALDYLVYCVAADRHDEAGYQAAYVQGLQHVLAWLGLHSQRPKRLLFVSSTSVYGQAAGEWVNEQAITAPAGFAGRVMLQAEALAHASGHPATRVRLAGIYGPGRERLLRQVREGYQVALKPALYANRIHADDAAGLLCHLLLADQAGHGLAPCYLGVDDAPAALAEVFGWLRQRLGVTHLQPGAFVRRTGSKRCSNALARASGWLPRYPSYREGYAALLGEAGGTLR
ncbi:NAD-dependent epimerase/dehydratase family protein [Pseudomonas typographi]|uniref:NAD-dependent epimerase/dehydratase family protein n=1 Tax=Pseudomonas typographi TaxID=2715964 RepID=UPI001685B236|nr:NAD-dependent epimerase/dehydratase family protein [Pseudomonas typographi]MBD1585460.1 NAD-dependent epimerase/dehydratase family protein [Pseudomonas typographi]